MDNIKMCFHILAVNENTGRLLTLPQKLTVFTSQFKRSLLTFHHEEGEGSSYSRASVAHNSWTTRQAQFNLKGKS